MESLRTVAAYPALLLAATAAAQTAPDYTEVATFVLDGKEQVLSRQMVALELARTFAVRDFGIEALNHLIDMTLVERAATAQKLMPSRDEVKGQVRAIEAGLLEHKQNLDEQLHTRRLTRERFEKQLALGIAKQRLVLNALGEKKPRVPTPTELQLWSKQARNKARVVLDREVLPAGVLATVDGTEIASAELGDILFMKVEAETLNRAVKDLVFRAIVKHLARQQHIELTEQDVDAHVRMQQQRHEADTQRKLPFASLLKATTGLTVAQFKRDPSLRAKVLYQKLCAKRYPASKLMDLFQGDRHNVLKRHGARRNLSVLLVRAKDHPNQIVKLDPEAAKKRIEELRQEIEKRRAFADVARIHSEGPNKKQGGAIGWCHQEDPEVPVPPEVVSKAFEAKINKVVGPVRTKEGFWLVWVTGIEPEPDDDVILKGLRGQLSQEYLEELFKAAKIQMKVR
jgi:peptidyl-prolyl cis-trans isomerase C